MLLLVPRLSSKLFIIKRIEINMAEIEVSDGVKLYISKLDFRLRDYELKDQGNIDFEWQTITLNFNGNYTVHQLKFEGIFNNETYLLIAMLNLLQNCLYLFLTLSFYLNSFTFI